MSNKQYQQFFWSNAKMPTAVFAQITFGSTGAPTLNKGNSDIASITRNGAGDYSIVFKETFKQLLHAKHVFNSGSSAPAAPGMYIKTNTTSASGKLLNIIFNAAGTPTDPASGEIVYLDFIFNNSSISTN